MSDDDENKISLISSREKSKINELDSAMEYMLQWVPKLAKIRKVSYDAHINEGFTNEEALELCKYLEM